MLLVFDHLAWAMVVGRTTGQQQVVFGTVLFGRIQANTSAAQAIGLFINTLPIRIDLDDQSVEESVRATHSRLAPAALCCACRRGSCSFNATTMV